MTEKFCQLTQNFKKHNKKFEKKWTWYKMRISLWLVVWGTVLWIAHLRVIVPGIWDVQYSCINSLLKPFLIFLTLSHLLCACVCMRGVGHACGDKRTISKDQLSPRMQVPGTELKSPVLVTSAFKITEQSSQHTRFWDVWTAYLKTQVNWVCVQSAGGCRWHHVPPL